MHLLIRSLQFFSAIMFTLGHHFVESLSLSSPHPRPTQTSRKKPSATDAHITSRPQPFRLQSNTNPFHAKVPRSASINTPLVGSLGLGHGQFAHGWTGSIDGPHSDSEAGGGWLSTNVGPCVCALEDARPGLKLRLAMRETVCESVRIWVIWYRSIDQSHMSNHKAPLSLASDPIRLFICLLPSANHQPSLSTPRRL